MNEPSLNRAAKRLIKRLANRQAPKPAPALRWNRLIGERNVFATIDTFLEQLASGITYVDTHGRTVFRAEDLEWYVADHAIAGWIDLWQRVSGKYRLGLELPHLMQLRQRLSDGASIPAALIPQAQAEINTCRRAYRSLPVSVCREEATNQCIRIQLEQTGLVTPLQ